MNEICNIFSHSELDNNKFDRIFYNLGIPSRTTVDLKHCVAGNLSNEKAEVHAS